MMRAGRRDGRVEEQRAGRRDDGRAGGVLRVMRGGRLEGGWDERGGGGGGGRRDGRVEEQRGGRRDDRRDNGRAGGVLRVTRGGGQIGVAQAGGADVVEGVVNVGGKGVVKGTLPTWLAVVAMSAPRSTPRTV